MNDLNSNSELSKYYTLISPSEISIVREDIFYRDKYNDIINYLKIMLTNHENSAIQEYIQPSGLLLININPGTDILDFLKLISKNYYLDFIEFNYEEILKNPNEFFNNFNLILKAIKKIDDISEKFKEQDKENKVLLEKYVEESKSKRLLIINQYDSISQNELLKLFIDSQIKNGYRFIEEGIVFIWINKNIIEIKENSRQIFQIFDLFIKVPLLNNIEREIILRNFSEKYPKIVFDINTIVDYTLNWEVKDINQLLKVAIFKHFLNSQLNETTNEITDVVIELIETGEFIPTLPFQLKKTQKFNQTSENNQTQESYSSIKFNRQKIDDINSIVKQIQEEKISDFMLNQLYENAASKNYVELVLIIDKLKKDEPLEENGRKLLAKYSFILNDSPDRAHINLEKAKKRIDHIEQVFGK